MSACLMQVLLRLLRVAGFVDGKMPDRRDNDEALEGIQFSRESKFLLPEVVATVVRDLVQVDSEETDVGQNDPKLVEESEMLQNTDEESVSRQKIYYEMNRI